MVPAKRNPAERGLERVCRSTIAGMWKTVVCLVLVSALTGCGGDSGPAWEQEWRDLVVNSDRVFQDQDVLLLRCQALEEGGYVSWRGGISVDLNSGLSAWEEVLQDHGIEYVAFSDNETFDEAADRVEEIWYEELEKAC